MTNPNTYSDQFDKLQACVIIPTYNNASTLAAIIRDLLNYTRHLIIVNDGSTDKTQEIIGSFPGLQSVSYPRNAGKGYAIRKGFAYALEKGYQYAITIDSDGQHFAKDLPSFLEALESEKAAIFIGARNMNQTSVPGKSSFGNRFSNFWFRVETGIQLPDTQSGYRLYPLNLLKNMKFITRKYEFEIEVLVRAAWKGVKVIPLPVSVYYPPSEERVSHFRPFKDFTRISILNTILVLITFFYIKPRNLLRTLFNKEKSKELIREHLLNNHQPDYIKSLSVGFGVFMGIVPIWGFQLVAAIFLAILFKLNKALVIVAANISIPPMIPLIIYLSYKSGAVWMGSRATQFIFSRNITLASIRENFEQYLYGSLSFALAAGAVSGLMTHFLIKLFKRKSVLAR